ncbi:MAG: purine-binding chemotaxis protein CheW [Anaerolineae bacterium]|nr:purine-binding chemotaxis protein CheW [Anaerolineae bacterium]
MNHKTSDDTYTLSWAKVDERFNAPAFADGAMGDILEPEILQKIWEQRAAQFAQVPEQDIKGAQIDLVIMRLGDELYGIDAQYVFRIRPVSHITRVPRVPAWIRGVTNERGRVLSVFDLQRFLGLHKNTSFVPVQSYLVLVETEAMSLALLTDQVLNVESLPVAEIQEAKDAVRGIPRAYVQGIVHFHPSQNNTRLERAASDVHRDDSKLLIVLDLEALLADKHLVIHEEIN